MEGLEVAALTHADLPAIRWSGSATHVRNVARQLERVAAGEVEYLVVRRPGGAAVAKGGVDYVAHPAAGTIWQLATHPDWQGRGIATHLIGELEECIVRRGLAWSWIGVEPDNPRARALYERLGYEFRSEREESWEAQRPDGELYLHSTTVVELAKSLC